MRQPSDKNIRKKAHNLPQAAGRQINGPTSEVGKLAQEGGNTRKMRQRPTFLRNRHDYPISSVEQATFKNTRHTPIKN